MSARATVGGSATGFAVGWNVANVGAVADELAAAYGTSLTAVGLLTTALFAAHLACQLPAGRAVDALGARRVGVAALAWIAVGNALTLATPSLALGLAGRALIGVGTSLAFVAASDHVRAQTGTTTAQGLFGGANVGGSALALALLPLLDGPIGWRSPFLTAAAIGIAAAALLLCGPGEARTAGARATAVRGPSVLGDRGLQRLALLYTATFGLTVVAGAWVVTLLERAGGHGAGAAGAIGALVFAGGIVSRPLGGVLARRGPDAVRPLGAGSLLACAAGAGLLALAGPAAVSALGAALLGLGAGLPFAAAFAAASRARPEAPGLAVAFVNGSAGIAVLALVPLAGLSFSLPGDGRLGFAIIALLALAALAALPLDSRRPTSSLFRRRAP